MAEQRAKSTVPASRRSIYPSLPGVPWWAAVVIAMTATAIGFGFDAWSGTKELTHVFAALYFMGCVFAVLAVRQSGVFTAIIQPPLILFCAVPGGYWLFHGAKIGGVKDILINYGYPLIERFPLMLFTSAGVLLIGMFRWYVDAAARAGAKANDDGTADAGGRIGRIAAIFAAVWGRHSADEVEEAAPKPRRRAHAVSRAPKTAASAGGARPTRRSASTRSRRGRPPLDDQPESPVERPRRRRSTLASDVEAVAEPPALTRRRARPPRDPDLRSQLPREIRRDAHVRRGRPTARGSRFYPDEQVQPPEPFPPYEPRRRPKSEAANGANTIHHPISGVRYRGAGHSRGSRSSAAEAGEYDI
ncbi:MAG: hypothetical protein JO106_16970 [Mycobacterium sp.]|nr:hypothetical protein [Mycobacterium sp.]